MEKPALTLPSPRVDQTLFREVLTAHTSPADWARWFKDLQIHPTPSEVLLVAPSRFVANQVVSRFLTQVESAVRTAGADRRSGVRVTVNPEAPPSRPRPPRPAERPTPASPERARPTGARARHPSNHHRFDNFEVGSSNLMAQAAAASVAEKPGRNYNPLFIYGASGLGKTHLLLAIAQRAREHRPDVTVHYCTSERFVQEFIQSVRTGRMEAFRRRFREVDILILDDFQFLQGKEQTLEEFFWTLDSLHQAGKHLVLGCDRSPRQLQAVADRTRSRISAGLIAEISAPGFDTRMAILAALNRRGPTRLTDEVLGIVAEHITDNIRDLASALRQLQAYAQLTSLPVTPDTVQEQLAPLSGPPSTPRTPQHIISICAESFGTTVDEILAHNRRPAPSEARQVAMYLTRRITGLPYARIGLAFDRGHSTVLSAERRVASRISSDRPFADRVTAILDLVHKC